MRYILPLPTPINQTYRTGKGRFYKSQEAKVWEEEAMYSLIRQRRGKNTILAPVRVLVDWYFNRDRDIDSGLKILLDFLQTQGIYMNDKQVMKLVVTKMKDAENPRVEVEIDELL